MQHKSPDQRWHIATPQPEKITPLVNATGLSPLMAQVILNRGIETREQAEIFVDPEMEQLPSPLEEFPDLAKSVEILKTAIAESDKIAICGDYDADGMTSTALLWRALKHLGANVDYAIPSRMKDGYGINKRIVEEFAEGGVGVILTVDNGIAAYDPILLAVDLGMSVIVTDHHEVPEKVPPADAILNPKLIRESSPYRGLAGVGVAYILAVTLAQELGKLPGLTQQLLDLFTLGTIADLAPLVGVNRRWLKRGLRRLPQSQIPGVQALMQMAGVSDEQKEVKPDDIGFRLGPRINAVGRIADPQIVIELLTTEDHGVALERAMQCEQINQNRQQLCAQIEQEAIAAIEDGGGDDALNQKTHPEQWREQRVLVIVQPNWHHGVIGIVASRLVERYGVPVFIGTYEEEGKKLRGSARGIPEFNIFDALNFCQNYLGKFGGHKAAGGFSLPLENLEEFGKQLSIFAHQCLQPEQIKPLVKIDTEANFNHVSPQIYQQIDGLQPWGIANAFPVFWTSEVRILEQKVVGKNHLKLVLGQSIDGRMVKRKAIAWRWGQYFPLPSPLDIAYKLQENHWNGNRTIELELVGARNCKNITQKVQKASFIYNQKNYTCHLIESDNELRIQNPQGKVLAVNKGQRQGLLETSQEDSKQVNVTQPPYYQIIKAALDALALKR